MHPRRPNYAADFDQMQTAKDTITFLSFLLQCNCGVNDILMGIHSDFNIVLQLRKQFWRLSSNKRYLKAFMDFRGALPNMLQ